MLFPWLVSFTNKTSIPLDNLPKYNSYGNVLEVTNLYDINENLRFHHVRFDNSYMIYDLEQDKYLEFNHSNYSPYDKHISSKIYYNGVNCYYYLRENQLYNCLNGSLVQRENLTYNILDTSISKTRSTEPITHFEVPYSRYFKNLDGVTNKFPLNVNGDCGYVASSILLGYYANFFDPYLACNHYMNVSNSNDVSDLYKYVTCFTQNFKDNVLKQPGDKNATIAESMKVILDRYIQKTNAKDHFLIDSHTISHEKFIRNFIENGEPVLLFGSYNDVGTGDYIDKHVVVVYGVTADKYLLCHLGYPNQSFVEIDSATFNFVGGRLFMKYLGSEHKHSSYHKVDGNPYCLVCGKFVNPVNMYKADCLNESSHSLICILCNHKTNENHTYTIYNNFYKKCIVCGFLKRLGEGEIIPRPYKRWRL